MIREIHDPQYEIVVPGDMMLWKNGDASIVIEVTRQYQTIELLVMDMWHAHPAEGRSIFIRYKNEFSYIPLDCTIIRHE